MFHWKKLGKIFDPTDHNTPDWMREYAQLPFPFMVDDSKLRIYFASRPERDNNMYVSRSGYIDVNPDNFQEISFISDKPIVELGGIGTFDEFGSMSSCFVRHEGKVYGYYTGWFRLATVPYSMSIGLMISDDNGKTFVKYGEGPILGLTPKEPFLVSGPIVKIVNKIWHMWYLTGTKWLNHKDKFEPVYKLVHATSTDGINWQRDGIPIIESKFEDECQVSFAIFSRNQKWHVIFAYRRPLDFRENSENSYRLGYAYSEDLICWHRNDEQLNFFPSETGWDSEMIAYPQILERDNKIFLFYCGNNFGKSGFGVAELLSSK